ncbi:MAG: hypothetical protein ABSH16_09130 [Sedimentisphaerales bacterium]
MKKLLALIVVVVILGICPSTKGLLLVYRVSSSVKGVDGTAGVTLTVPFKAYLVMDFNERGVYRDANMLMFGNNADGSKVYYQLNDSDSNNLLDTGVWNKGIKAPYLFVGLGTYGADNPFDFEACMWGKMTVKDIGFGKEHLWLVPTSMKGTFTVWYKMLYDADQNISGTGDVSAKLDPVTYNFNAEGWSKEDAVALIINALQDKDYSQGVIKIAGEAREQFEMPAQADGGLFPVIKKTSR